MSSRPAGHKLMDVAGPGPRTHPSSRRVLFWQRHRLDIDHLWAGAHVGHMPGWCGRAYILEECNELRFVQGTLRPPCWQSKGASCHLAAW